jgi:putative flavoprotein involved in K+ transport
MLTGAGPLVRTKPTDIAAAGVERVSKTAGVKDGLPVLEDGRVLDVANVIWATGFHPGFSWIDLPVLGEHEPLHQRGVVPSEPGLYFVGLHYLFAVSSAEIHGVARDAVHIAEQIAARSVDSKARPEISPSASSEIYVAS